MVSLRTNRVLCLGLSKKFLSTNSRVGHKNKRGSISDGLGCFTHISKIKIFGGCLEVTEKLIFYKYGTEV